jgi:alkanesulfonate monooxygenase SsuD/methylene tetrahydromethanopterin reductase-like flavin-dependent oxidoreductase (luciferase family)
MQLGAACVPQVPPERIPDVARAAEAAGLDELWVWEDCFWGSGTTGVCAALAATERLRVGVALLPVPLRNVALTAMEITTLHRLFPGRVTVCVGHGVQAWMAQVGARAESPLMLLREYVAALRALLRGETVSVTGRYVNLDKVRLDWTATPAPPVYIGAVGPKTLRLAGELADGTVLDRPGGFEAAYLTIEEGRLAAGRPERSPVVVNLPVTAGDDEAAVTARVRELSLAGADTVVLVPPEGETDPEEFMRLASHCNV